MLPMSGGDAFKITNASNDVEQFDWKPDGTQIAFVSQGSEIRSGKRAARFLDGFEVGNNDYPAQRSVAPVASLARIGRRARGRSG